MNEVVKIGDSNIPVLEWKGQRVVTTAQLAEVYGATEKQIKQNFNNNKEHFQKGKHYYLLEDTELKTFKRQVENFDLPLADAIKFASHLYLWTRRGASRHCKMLGTDKAWEQFDRLEENYYNPQMQPLSGEHLISLALIEANRILAQKEERIESLETDNAALQKDNDRMKPKEIFADAVSASHTSILIGDLAKLLKQNGYETGQKRLFAWLRDNDYLIKGGASKNMPTQRSMDMGLFDVKETTITNPDGSVRVTKTTKVTGKGQQYFINRFLKEA